MKPFLILGAFAVLSAGAAGAAEKHPPAVLDGAKLFSPKSIERVGQVAADLRKTFGLDLCIETAKEAPGLESKSLRGMKPRDINKALRKAAQEGADKLGVNGLYALITVEPTSARVVGWPASRERERETSDHKRRQLEKALAGIPLLLSDGSPRQDAEAQQERGRALVRAVEEYRQAVGEKAQASPLKLLSALVVGGSLLGAWLFLMIVRSRRAAPQRPLPIYQPAMQGSLFGVPAGYWVHDRLFYAERPAILEAAPLLAEAEPPRPAPAEDAGDGPKEGEVT